MRTSLRARRTRSVIVGVIVAAVVVVGVVGLVQPSGGSPQAASPGVGRSQTADAGRRAAPLAGDVLVGTPADFRLGAGHAVVVNFWASWCDPCRREAPELVRYAASRPTAPLVGVAVNDGSATARSFIAEFGWRFPNLLDANGSLMTPYRVPGLPTTIVIDRDGRIAARLLGPQTLASLRHAAAAVEAAS